MISLKKRTDEIATFNVCVFAVWAENNFVYLLARNELFQPMAEM